MWAWPPIAGGDDGDRAQAEAIWCLVAHLRPATVVETGVAHGLTSRVILEGLHRNGNGHLWSVDLPAVIRRCVTRSAWPSRRTCGPAGRT